MRGITRSCAAWLSLGACGRISFEPLATADASRDDAVDAACAWGPFSAPIHVPQLASASAEYATAISADNLTIVFDTLRASSTWDLWQARRQDASMPFDTPTVLANINTAFDDDNPALSADGRTIYFSSNRTAEPRIYFATRSSTAVPFDPPVLLGGLANFGACCPSISADELTIYLSVDPGGGEDIYVATRPDRMTDFSTPVELTALSSNARDWTPSISGDGLELYFQTDRGGVANDIYVSRRPTISELFPLPAPVTGLATTMYSESDPSISHDGTTLWFAIENGPSSLGFGDIYYATRECL